MASHVSLIWDCGLRFLTKHIVRKHSGQRSNTGAKEDNNQKDRLNTTNNRRGTIGSLDVPAHTNTGYEIVPLLMKAT